MEESMSLKLRTVIVVGVLTCVLGAGVCAAQVRSYPDPGYSRMGIYGGGPSWLDYETPKMQLDGKFPNKKYWWASLKAQREAEPLSHDIYIIYPGLRRLSTPIDTVIQNVDAWLAPEPGIETYPELIPAICLAEENRQALKPRLDVLARHIRDTYGIPVIQWLEGWSDPLPPSPGLMADGWAFDYYFFKYPDFRKHLMKFVALDKPIICCVWASDPDWPDFMVPTRPRPAGGTEELLANVEDQFESCKEFNVSTLLFAVGGRSGGINAWVGSQNPDMIALRNWLRVRQAQMHVLRPDDLPLPSANFSGRGGGPPWIDNRRHTIFVGGTAEEPSVYEDGFGGFRWIEDANITGFLDLKLTSVPADEPGFLLAKTHQDRPVDSTLTYRFESHFPLRHVEAELVGSAPAAAGAVNELALSFNEQDWSVAVEQSGNTALEPLVLQGGQAVQGRHVFYLRLRLRNDARAEGVPANRLDRFTVRCVHDGPDDAVVRLSRDVYDKFRYRDDFYTSRWRHLGTLTMSDPEQPGWRPGSHDLASKGLESFWERRTAQGGFAVGAPEGSELHLTQRFSSAAPLTALTVSTVTYIFDEGGHVDLGIGPRGGEMQWKVSTDAYRQEMRGRMQAFEGFAEPATEQRRNWLTLEVPSEELGDLRDFDVHILLRSSGRVEPRHMHPAAVHALEIEGK
jgi:hypothetical protein